jgi:ERCC4-type nuclease
MKSPPPTILIDTREQVPFALSGYTTRTVTLRTGDYSIDGYEDKVAVERKSKEDAYGCVGTGRKRFTDCLERLAALDRAAIVIERSIEDFDQSPPARTKIDSRMAIGSYISWSCKYRIPVFWCHNKLYAERITVRFLMAYLKHVAK